MLFAVPIILAVATLLVPGSVQPGRAEAAGHHAACGQTGTTQCDGLDDCCSCSCCPWHAKIVPLTDSPADSVDTPSLEPAWGDETPSSEEHQSLIYRPPRPTRIS